MFPKFNAVCGISESEFKRDFTRPVAEFSEENMIGVNFSTETRTLTDWVIEERV